jgi:hypothetical protein
MSISLAGIIKKLNRKTCCEGVVAESQDVQDGRPDAALPAAGNWDLAVHLGLRELLLIRDSRRS